MIQRKQTIFLILAIICSVICLSLPLGTIEYDEVVVGNFYNLWAVRDGVRSFITWPLFAILLVTIPLAIVAIFAYNNRRFQIHLCNLCMLLILGWYIVTIVIPKSMLTDMHLSITYSYGAALPFISMVMYFLAKRGVIADEKLIKSTEHFR